VTTDSGKPPTLEYGHPPDRRPLGQKALAFGGLISALLCLAASLFVVEVLHNTIIWEMVALWGLLASFTLSALMSRRLVSKEHAHGRRTATTAAVVLGLALLLGGLSIYRGLTEPDPHFEARNVNHCSANLERLFGDLEMYAEDHGKEYPQSLRELARWDLAKGSPIDGFSSPASWQPNGYASPTPTTQAIMNELADEKSASYIYLAAGMHVGCYPGTVLIHDAPSDHEGWGRGGGMHVLYASGRVEWLGGKDMKHLLAELALGHNPPRTN
jgi:hypothetical protein